MWWGPASAQATVYSLQFTHEFTGDGHSCNSYTRGRPRGPRPAPRARVEVVVHSTRHPMIELVAESRLECTRRGGCPREAGKIRTVTVTWHYVLPPPHVGCHCSSSLDASTELGKLWQLTSCWPRLDEGRFSPPGRVAYFETGGVPQGSRGLHAAYTVQWLLELVHGTST